MTPITKAPVHEETTSEINQLPRQKLQQLVAKFGLVVCANPDRCEATLKQLCPHAILEVNVLISVLRENLVAQLLKAPKEIPAEITIKQLSEKLQNDLFIDDNYADWAIESWALALGIIQQPLPKQSLKSNITPTSEVKVEEQSTQTELESEPAPAPVPSKPEIPPPPPEQRIGKFIIRDSLAIDAQTGLTWCRLAYGQHFENSEVIGNAKRVTWHIALDIAERFNHRGGYAGFTDWRLPSMDELKTLIDKVKGKEGHYIDEEVFPCDVQMFWAALPGAGGGYEAWTVNFVNGTNSSGGNYSSYAVRLVRKSRNKEI